MNRLEILASSFSEELVKIAVSNPVAMGLAAAGAGDLYQGAHRYNQAREQGKGVGGSLLQGARGVGEGALVGGGLSAAASGLGRVVSPVLTEGAEKAVANFGRRQVHAVTGYVPDAVKKDPSTFSSWAKGIGIGEDGAAVANAAKHRAEVESGAEKSWFMPQSWKAGLARRSEARAIKDQAASDVLVNNRVTSIPGMYRALKDSDARKSVLPAVGHQVFGGSMGKVNLGLTGLGAASALARDTDQEGRHLGWGERVGGAAGTAATMALPGTIPLVGQLGAQAVLGSAAARAGRVADRAVGIVRPPTIRPPASPSDPLASEGPHVERGMSSSAAGKSYGGGIG